VRRAYKGSQAWPAILRSRHRYLWHQAQRFAPAQFEEKVTAIVRRELKRLASHCRDSLSAGGPGYTTDGAVQPCHSQKPTKQSILEREQHDPRLDELNDLIACAPKRAAKRRPELPPEVSRLAMIVRGQVAQFRRMHSDYEQLFETWLGPFGMNSSATRNGAIRRKWNIGAG